MVGVLNNKMASNYVSDPAKLARELRKQTVSSKLVLPRTAQWIDHSQQQQQQQAPVQVPEVSQLVRFLWSLLFQARLGLMATKYFDPNTYMDDPSAKLVDHLERWAYPIRLKKKEHGETVREW